MGEMCKIYYKTLLFTMGLKKHGNTVNVIYGARVDHILVKHRNLQLAQCITFFILNFYVKVTPRNFYSYYGFI